MIHTSIQPHSGSLKRFLLAATLTLQPLLSFGQTTEFANIKVIQNDSANTAASVTVTKEAGSSPNFSIRAGSNRGDVNVSFGSADDLNTGVMITCISENGRTNADEAATVPLFYATSASNFTGINYYIPLFSAFATATEANINTACAWFPYNQWLGGFVRNSTATNGGANDTMIASTGLTAGTPQTAPPPNFIDNGGGISTVNLTSVDATATSANGVLVVTHGKDEDNYAFSRANGDGGFTVWVKDNGTNGSSSEQDPVSFVYVPTSAVGTNRLVALGRVNSTNGGEGTPVTTDVAGGTFTLTKGGTGEWFLTIPEHDNTTGVLIVSADGGTGNSLDNIVSYQWDATNLRWVIQSRDISATNSITSQPGLQDGATAGEDMFSFAFFAVTNVAPTVALTAPVNNGTSIIPTPVTFEATAADTDGTVVKVEYLVNAVVVGESTTGPGYTYSWTPQATGIFTITARATDNIGARTTSAPVALTVMPNVNQGPLVTPTLPAANGVVNGTTVSLEADLDDPEGDPMTVTFYGRYAAPAAPGPDFTVVALPDTQFYTEGAASHANSIGVQDLIDTFGAQTGWIVDNQAALNIAYVSHMGDLVQNGNFNGNPIQWQRASAAMAKLEDPLSTLRGHGIPYGMAPGNHDIDPVGAYDTGSTAYYQRYFDLSRFAGRGYWGGNYAGDNTNNYQLFSAGGLDFISIHLAYDASPNATVLNWADQLLKTYPQRRAIVTSHAIIGKGNPGNFATPGVAIYTKLKTNPNLFLMLCGYAFGEGRRTDTFEGNTVHTILTNYQGLPDGGSGFLRTLTFSPANNRIHVESYSPTLHRAVGTVDGVPGFGGSYDLTYEMQQPMTDWIPLGAPVPVDALGTTVALTWTGLQPGRTFEWYMSTTDGVNVVNSPARQFSTSAGQAPTVTLDTPTVGSTFTAPASVTFTATPSDLDSAIARVEYYSNGTKIGEASSAPYSFIWTGVLAGTYVVNAVAVDESGLTGISAGVSITVGVGDSPPSITLSSPVDGSFIAGPAPLTLTAAATDAQGPVNKVEFLSGAVVPVVLGEVTQPPFELPLGELALGTYVFSARATDSLGQVTTSPSVSVTVFTEPAAPSASHASVGNFDLPGWTVATTSPAPYQFNDPGVDVGDLELRINGTSVPFSAGIGLATGWGGPASTGGVSNDNIVQPYNGSGNLWVNVVDNSNNNPPTGNPSTSEQSSGVSVAFLPYADGFTGASIATSAGVLSGNLPPGVTMVKLPQAGGYAISGLSTAGNLLAFTNGDAGTLVDNVCSVRDTYGTWVVDTRDNDSTGQNNEFSFVYIPPTTVGVYAGKVSSQGVVSNTNVSATEIGVQVTMVSNGMELRFGDGSVVNPSTATIFVTGDSGDDDAENSAGDNLISWNPSGNGFRVFSQDLPEITGAHENINFRFLVIPFVPVLTSNEVNIVASDNTAGEFGADRALSFTISRLGPISDALTIPVVFEGTAASADYTGEVIDVTIPAGQATVELPLTVIADQLAEGEETVVISLLGAEGFTVGSVSAATATIADRPSQDWAVQNITNPAKRAGNMDADDDGISNVIEYFMGTLPADSSSMLQTTINYTGNTATFHYPHALDRPDATAKVQWSTDLTNWFSSGQSNGTLTINIVETTTSAPADNPQLIDATLTNPAGALPTLIFVRLLVTE